MKRSRIGLFLVVFLLAASFVSVALPAMAKPGPKADVEVEGPSVGVIVHTAKPYGEVTAAIEALGGSVTIEYVNADAVAAEVPFGNLGELAATSGVAYIEKDVIVEVPAPSEPMYGRHPMDADGIEILDSGAAAELIGEDPENYYSYLSGVTGAEDTWAETGAGADSLVAIIDSGTEASHPCLAGRVIEGPNFSGDGISSISPLNFFHGTFVGGVMAADCVVVLPAFPEFTDHLPADAWIDIGGGQMLLPLLGIAPAAEMYAVKVFPASGAGVPSSVIEQALDHVITQKTSGALDIDVINMSLGGASIADGKSLEEQLVDAATAADMTVVIASGNEGPAPNSIARPGTANTALAVGGTTDEVHTRIFWDFNIASGAGATLYPTDELRIADFSNIGPTADGRVGVDVVATGVFNFSTFPTADPFGPLGWSSGTSFATPQGAGAAALLNAWAENNDPSIDPTQIQNAIKGGASPMDAEWTEFQQGAGFLNVPNALDLLQNGNVSRGGENSGNTLKPTVLKGNKSTVTETVTLERGRTASWVFEIDENTESVDIDIDLDGAVAPGPGAAFGFPNSFEFYVKSAKRGGAPYLIETLNFVDDAEATIGDGFINTSGFSAPDVDPEPAPMEPGLMKVIVEADWTNNVDELTATVTITRNQGPGSSNIGGYTGTLGNHEFQVFVVDIPAGTTEAIFDLNWKHDWSKFPTNDLDMLFASPSSFPSFDFSFLDGASLNVPERQTIENPEAGTWFVIVDGFEVIHGKDPFKLDVTLIP